MRKTIPYIFFSGLIAWFISFWVIALGHADLISIGRERVFGITVNIMFLFSTLGGIFWAIAKAKRLLTPMIIASGLWVAVCLSFGFLPYILGLFGAPSEDKIIENAIVNGYSQDWITKALNGPVVSASTSYMVDVYQWQLLAEVKHKNKQ